MNFAAVHKLPFVMLVENNEWAISTPLDKQMAQPEIWKRAAGYGMPGARFNGFDPIETYAAVKEAMDRARGGGGPTLVEGTCYRYLAHSTDDNDMTYRTREDVLERRKQDPVPAFEALLLEHGIMSADDVAAMRKDVLRETNEATDAAEALPYPAAAELYTHVSTKEPGNRGSREQHELDRDEQRRGGSRDALRSDEERRSHADSR